MIPIGEFMTSFKPEVLVYISYFFVYNFMGKLCDYIEVPPRKVSPGDERYIIDSTDGVILS